MTAYSQKLDRLWAEIALYLEITDLLAETDDFWKEYCAWKNLTAMRAKIVGYG